MSQSLPTISFGGPNWTAKYSCFKTIEENTFILKLDLVKIELLEKNYMKLEFYIVFFFFFLNLIAYNSIFRKSSLKQRHFLN